MDPLNFVYDISASRVIFAPGSRRALSAEVDRLGGRRLLVVVAEAEASLAEEIVAPLRSRVVDSFSAIAPHVPAAAAEAAVAAARQAGADVIVSIGGGSTTGTAKAIALETGLPIVALPTTYAGSEVTPVWGMTTNGRKVTGRSPLVVPRVVIYDPDLTLSLPVALTVASAINALAHAVEALYAPLANPLSSILAVEGIGDIAKWLPVVVDDPVNPQGRAALLYGCFLAGTVFATAGSSLHHKICHVLGGAFDLPHAETHTILLPHVVAWVSDSLGGTLDDAAAALGSESAAEGIRRLVARVGAPTRLSDFGLDHAGVETAVGLVMESDLSSSPRPVTGPDVHRILLGALNGSFDTEGASTLARPSAVLTGHA